MADTSLNVNIKAAGTESANRALKDVAQSAEAMKTAIQPDSSGVAQWVALIAVMERLKAAEKEAADAAQKLAGENHKALKAGAASEWNDRIGPVKQYQHAQQQAAEAARKLAEESKQAIRAGAASEWSKPISAVKQYQHAQEQAAEAARKLAEESSKAQSAGLASAWSPEILRGRQMQQTAQDAALGGSAKYVPAGGKLHSLNQSMVDAQAAAQDRYGALTNAAATYGRGALLAGGAGLYGLGRAAIDAGNLQQTRKSIESYDGGKELYQQLLQFDKSSPMNLQEVLAQGQSALAQDFKASEIVPMFNTLGDAVVKAGGGTQEFASAMVQIAQIKNKGVASMQDIKAMAEGAKLPIIPILKEALGDERVKGILSGDEPISADELFDNLFEGLKKRSGGAMQDYMDTLPGALGELESNFYMLRTEIGEHLVPVLKLGTEFLNGVVGAFRALPGPLQSIVAVGGGLIFGLTALAGGVATTVGPILNLIQTISMLRNAQAAAAASSAGLTAAETATGVAAQGAAASLLTTLLPALAAMALAVIAVAAIIKGIEWWNDAKTKSDGEMAEKGPVEGFIARMGRKLGDNSEVWTDEDERGYQGAMRQKKQKGEPLVSRKAWKGDTTASDEMSGDTPEQVRAEKEKQEREKMQKDFKDQLEAFKGVSPATGMAAQAQLVPGVPASAMAGAATSYGDAEMVDSLESDIENLKRESRTADKDRKKAISDLLFEKGIALKHAKAAAAKQKQENKAAEKKQKEALKTSIEDDRLGLDVKSTETEERYNTRLAQLEAERSAAQQAKNVSREAQLKFEIDKLQAERDYVLAKISADATGLENEKKRDAMLRIADAKKKGALERAQIAYNSARSKVAGASTKIRVGLNGVLAGLPAGLQTRGMALAAESPVFNPYANARYDTEPFTRMIDHGGSLLPAWKQGASSARNERIAKVKHRQSRTPNGKIKIEFETVEIDDPVQEMGGRI